MTVSLRENEVGHFLLTRTLYTELSELQNEAVPLQGQGRTLQHTLPFCSPCGRETESKSLRTMATHDLRSNQGRDGWQGEQLHFPRVPHVGRTKHWGLAHKIFLQTS